MMTRERIGASRAITCWATNDVGGRAVSLYEIEICGCEIGEGMFEVADKRDGFQENFREYDR